MSCDCCSPLGPAPTPPGGSIEPLSLLLVVDPSGGSGTQDGAFTEPQTFSTLAAAIAAATTGSTLLLMPSDYTPEGPLGWVDKTLSFVGIGYEQEQTQLPDLEPTGPACAVRVENCQTLKIDCPTGPVHIERGLLSGEVIAATSTLLETRASIGAALTSGTVRTDLYSFNAFGAVLGVLTGGPFEILDSRVFSYEFFCERDAYPNGNGSEGAPYDTLRAAVDAAPTRDISPAVINLGMGDWFDGSPIPYTDKRLCVRGAFILNESPDPPTHGVHLQPLSSDDSNLELEIIRTNSNVSPKSQGIVVLLQDAHCECVGDGVNFGTWINCGSSAVPNRLSTLGTQQSAFSGVNYGLVGAVLSTFEMIQGIIFVGCTTGTGYVQSSEFRDSVFCSGLLEIYNSRFTIPNLIVTGNPVRTDLATYARGVDAGVTWPAATEIVDLNVQLQPFVAAVGAGANGAGSANAALGSNEVDDVFVYLVNSLGGAAPTLPAGWTLQAQEATGGIFTQLWTRDAPSTGGEVGNVLATGVGGLPTQGVILTMRNVQLTGGYVESVGTTTTTGASPLAVAGATVAATGKGRTALMVTGSNDATAGGLCTGQTGGVWANVTDFASGLGANINVQSTALADSGTVTGGTYSVTGTRAQQLHCAFIGAIS